jgi:hypothetical protein
LHLGEGCGFADCFEARRAHRQKIREKRRGHAQSVDHRRASTHRRRRFLGGTVLRDQVAGARALAQTVVVDNPSAHPVPVEEQRVDGSGNLDYRPAACDGPRCRLGDFDFSTTIEVPAG